MSAASDSAADIAVIIVTYKSGDDIDECLTRLSDADNLQVIVVDNDSSDDSVPRLEELERRGDISTLILNYENVGFAKAVNAGIAVAKDKDVFLLNPDAQISGRDINTLRVKAQRDPSIGIIAPLVSSGPTVAVMAAGRQPTLWPLFTHFSGLARAFPDKRSFRGRHLFMAHHSREQQDVEWVSGCALFVRADVLARVGVLSERWFMYGEDVEFAHRVLKSGYRVIVTPDVQAQHLIGSSVNKAGGRISTMWAENTYDYYVSEFEPNGLQRLLWRVIFSGGMLSRALLFVARAQRDGVQKHEYLARARRFTRFSLAVWKRGS
ncbi:glycosyltransferase family 2 protein [Frigoribacterium faeni]|uniref:glycosyltransferase family 2 protein n=1 Tax=Frigoribacterium faeni TaxID=145483 RepID=UPI001FAC6B16|nr:glycosyltransferase family 2 protein [Frigoribacterium faeni]MCJ0700452.1 glycosyltransferase family 2 protein [Frigoribacterium faeni]